MSPSSFPLSYTMYLTHIIPSPGKTLITFFLPNSSNIHKTLYEPQISMNPAELNQLRMHTPLTFQLIIKDCFSSKLLQICGACLRFNLNTSSSKTTATIITYPSYFYHLYTQLLLHHNFHTTISISFSRPPQLISPSFHPQHLVLVSHLPRTTHINHDQSPSSSFSVLLFLFFHSDYINFMSQPTAQSGHQATHHNAGFAW